MTPVDRQQAFSGTKDAAPALRIDVEQLERYLNAQIERFAGPLTVRQFKGGQSNPTYLLETPARSYVLRRKPPGKLLPSAHAVDREYRVISALHAQDFPVAEPLVYCAEESVAGTPFYVMDFVDGRVFWEPQMPGSNPAERAAVYDSMNATIAHLHGLDPAKIGLGDFGKGENYVARQVDRWSKQYRASETEKIDAMERLIDWLPKHIPPNASVRLVHGDYQARQSDRCARSAEDRSRARLGAIDAGRSAGRLQLPSNGLAHAPFRERGRYGDPGRTRYARTGYSADGRLCRRLTLRVPDWTHAHICRFISPIISSVLPRSCRGSLAAFATVPRQANSRRQRLK